MKKFLLAIICCILCVSYGVNAKEYNLSETEMCGKDQLCDKDGKLLDGIVRSFWKNGQLQSESLYKEGKREGDSKAYYENGNLKSEGFYRKGEVEGTYKMYYENGSLMKEVPYKKGNTGATGTVKEYYKDGNLRREMFVDNGEIRGIVKEYYKNHKLKEKGKYKDGTKIWLMWENKEGLWEKYDVNGVLGYEEYYKDGLLEWSKDYDEKGILKSKHIYQYDSVEGERQISEYYYENGNLWFEANYKGIMPKAVRSGLLVVYDEQGNKSEEIMFKEDEPVYGYFYDRLGRRRDMTKAHLHNRTKTTKEDDKAIQESTRKTIQRFQWNDIK